MKMSSLTFVLLVVAQEVARLKLNPADMRPHDTGYYMYMGSVTAPPCTEGVKWFVLKSPVDISAAQVAAFARVVKESQ
jgi:carbonic anhydrase